MNWVIPSAWGIAARTRCLMGFSANLEKLDQKNAGLL